MSSRRDRRRFERTVARAMRSSKRPSAIRSPSTAILTQLARRVGAWPVAVASGIALALVAFYLAVPYASRPLIAEPTAGDAQAVGPGPATVVGLAPDASERRRAEIREMHLRQLQPVLRAEAEQLSELARRAQAEGRVTRSISVSPRALSEDLRNHYPEYSQARERLRRNVSEQDEEFRRATSLVMASLSLHPGAPPEHRRAEVARALLEKCLDRGPGMAATTTMSEDERAAFEAFTSFQPSSEVAAHCESLKRRAAGIAASARKLSTDARALAERTALPGECKYTSLE